MNTRKMMKFEVPYLIGRKLLKRKDEDGYGNKSLEEYIKFLVKDVNLKPTEGQQVQAGTEVLLPIWMQNFSDNLPFIRFGNKTEVKINEYDSHDLSELAAPEPVEGAAVVVGRGPSLFNHKHLEMLAEHINNGSYKGIVCSSDGALIDCLKAGIVPTLNCTVDGSPIIKKWYNHPLVREHANEIKVALNATANHEVYTLLRDMNCKIFWFYPMFDDWRSLESWTKMQRLMTKSKFNDKPLVTMPCGGNCISNDAWVAGVKHIFKMGEAKIGDQVWSLNLTSRQFEKTKILNVIPKGLADVYELRTSTRRVIATADHYFLRASAPVIMHRLSIFGKERVQKQRKMLRISCKEILDHVKMGLSTYEGVRARRKRINHEALLKLLEFLNISFADSLVDDTIKSVRRKWTWVPLSQLQKGDRILILKKLPVDIKSPLSLKEFGIAEIKETTNDFMRIVGAFLGDGYIRIRSAPYRGGSFHLCIPKQDKNRQKYIKLLQETFKRKVSESQNSIDIYFKPLAVLFDKLGLNKKASEKTIPQWVFALPEEQQRSLIEGLFDTDGSVDGNGTIQAFELSSKILIEQLRSLLIFLGYRVANIYYRKRKIDIINQRNKKYYYAGAESWRVRAIDKPYFNYGIRAYAHPPIYAYIAQDVVRSIKPFGKQEVSDITIDKNHNFIADGVLAHNCGTASWVMAISLFKRSRVALIGFDFGYPEGTNLEETPYFSTVMSAGKNFISQAYVKEFHPGFRTYAYIDSVFTNYRESFRSMILQAPVYSKTYNCTMGGTLWAQGLECITFKRFLQLYGKM